VPHASEIGSFLSRFFQVMKVSRLRDLLFGRATTVTRDQIAEMSTRDLRELLDTMKERGVVALAREEIAFRERFMADTAISICVSDRPHRG
jgi:hypothetical protein